MGCMGVGLAVLQEDGEDDGAIDAETAAPHWWGMEDRIGCERFERLLEEASDFLEEEDRQEIGEERRQLEKGGW